MCSTPEPTTTSWMPAAIRAAPKVTACWAEAHWRGGAARGVAVRPRRLDREPLLQPRVAGDVEGLLAELRHAAGDDVLDLGRIDARAVEHLGVRLAEQGSRVRALLVALLLVAAADRRADGLDDDDLAALLLSHGWDDPLVLAKLTAESGTLRRRMSERLGIAGSGAIACGLATAAAEHGDVVLWARSEKSHDRARATVEKRFETPDRVQVVGDLAALGELAFVVEAIVEETEAK